MKNDRFARIMPVVAAFGMAWAERLRAEDLSAPVAAEVEECSASIRSAPSFVWRGASGRGYETGAPSMWQDGMVRVEVSSGTCAYSLVVDPSTSTLSGASGTLELVLSRDPGGMDLASTSVDPASSPFTGAGSTGDVDEFPIYLSLPAGQSIEAGEYAGTIPVQLFLVKDGIAVQADEAAIDVYASVGARLAVSAPGFSSGVADIDLGDISEGFSRAMQFEIAGNAPVSVSVSSLNRGALKHERAEVYVPYRASLDGIVMDTSSGMDSTRLDISPSRTETVFLELSADPVYTPVAGVYTDVLTLAFRSDR